MISDRQKIQQVEDMLDRKIVLTEDEIEKCREAVHRTYSYISDELPEDISRTACFELILDRIYQFGSLPKDLESKLISWTRQEIVKYNKKQKLSWKNTLDQLAKVIW